MNGHTLRWYVYGRGDPLLGHRRALYTHTRFLNIALPSGYRTVVKSVCPSCFHLLFLLFSSLLSLLLCSRAGDLSAAKTNRRRSKICVSCSTHAIPQLQDTSVSLLCTHPAPGQQSNDGKSRRCGLRRGSSTDRWPPFSEWRTHVCIVC